MASANAVIRRALLYVPASSQKMLDKSRSLTVDCVAYDLEDSVTKAQKPAARSAIHNFLGKPRAQNIREQAVRINAVETGLALDDLTEVLKAPNLDTLVLPKCQSASDLHFVSDVIKHLLPSRHPSSPTTSDQPPPLKVLALIESARALSDLSSICKATPTLLQGLIFAAEDFALDLSMTRTPSLTEFLYARSAIVIAARAHNLPSAIDLVCTQYEVYKDDAKWDYMKRECEGGKALGFNGKQIIHPNQIELAHGIFAPGMAELEWAVRCVIADKKAEEQGRGAWTLDGKMIDAPVSGKARAILERARACGKDVEELMERWKGQEPE